MSEATQHLSPDSVRRTLSDHGVKSLSALDLLGVSAAKGRQDAGLGAVSASDALSPAERESLKAYQRVTKAVPNLEQAKALLDQGLTSNAAIAKMSERAFVEGPARAAGLTAKQARQAYARATAAHGLAQHAWASVATTSHSPHFQQSKANTLSTDLNQTFQDLPGYQELFGSLDYCRCEHCQSIFGPAAYFVDMMRIIDERIDQVNAIATGFRLAARRPDLAQIPLTCANTNDLLPYLRIVRERLSDTAAGFLQISGDDAVLKALATQEKYPRVLPFNAPLNQMRVQLDKVGAAFPACLAAWGIAADVVAWQSLGYSPDQRQVLVTVLTDAAAVAPYFNTTAAGLDGLADVSAFLAATALSYDDLGLLIRQDLTTAEISAGVSKNFFINQGLGANPLAIEEGTGGAGPRIAPLNATALDAINRALRLGDGLALPPDQVDWALRAAAGGGTPVLTDAALHALADTIGAAERLGLDLMSATALVAPLRSYGETAPFDTLFNTPSLVARFGTYHPSGNALNPTYTDPPLTWTPGATTDADQTAINRVLPGLGISLDAVVALAQALFGSGQLTLDVATLSSLHRHGLLSRRLGQTMDRYLKLLSLFGAAGTTQFTPTALTAVLDGADWLSATGLTVYELDYAVTGTVSVYVNPGYDAGALTDWQRALWVQVPNADAETAESEVLGQLATLLGTDGPTLTPLQHLVTQAVAPPSGLSADAWYKAFLAHEADGRTPSYPAYVAEVVALIARWLLMAGRLRWPGALLTNLAAHPTAYGLASGSATPTRAAIQGTQTVASLITAFDDRQFDLLAYIAADAAGQDAAARTALTRATGWDESQISQLLAGPVQNVTPVPTRLDRLNRCFTLIQAAGADTAFMTLLAGLSAAPASQWSLYTTAADQTQAKVEARFGDQWASIALNLQGLTLVAERDALLGYVQTQLNAQYADITTPNNVYEFMLIDVEMGPETQISYIKEALNACQLYLQRCRLGLEPGVETVDIPGAWWEWLLNYRLWEANRKIFVYPENYLVPSLRTPTTTLFKNLKDTLEQGEITQTAVEKALRTYIDGFSTLAKLKPVDAYRCIVNDPDRGDLPTLFLFGRADTDPYTFYMCRKADGYPWTDWREITLQIKAPLVTPVYALDRLFLFWLEMTATTTSQIEAKGNNSVSANTVSYKATVHYSFLNHQGEWVQPQILIDDTLVLVRHEGVEIPLSDNILFKNLYRDMTSGVWSRVYAFRTTGANHAKGWGSKTDPERITLFFGPFVNPDDAQQAPTNPDLPTSGPESVYASHLLACLQNHDSQLDCASTAQQPLQTAISLSPNLDRLSLLQAAEFVTIGGYVAKTGGIAAGSPMAIGAVVDDLEGRLKIGRTASVVADDYLTAATGGSLPASQAGPLNGQSFASATIDNATSVKVFNALKTAGVLDGNGAVQAAKLDQLDLFAALTAVPDIAPLQYLEIQKTLFAHLGGTELLGAVDDERARTLSVKNQPGWFILNNGDEVFLFWPKRSEEAKAEGKGVFSSIDNSLLVSPARMNPFSFVMPANQYNDNKAIDRSVSSQVFDFLATMQMIDTHGVVDLSMLDTFGLESVLGTLIASGAINKKHLDLIEQIMRNAPVVYENSFKQAGLSFDVSKQVFDFMQGLGLLDGNARLRRSLLTGTILSSVLSTLVINNVITHEDISAIYRVLNAMPSETDVTYWNQGNPKDVNAPQDLVFNVTRLTTAAIHRLSRALFVGGIESLLAPALQEIPVTPIMPFDRFKPVAKQIVYPSAVDGAQVDFDGLYGQYFWEIYYHVPMLIAEYLTNDQRFQDAQSWQQYVFDPTQEEQFVTAAGIVDATDGTIGEAEAAEIIKALQGHNIGTPPAPILDSQGRVNPQFTATTDLSFLKDASPVLTDEMILMVRNILLNRQLIAPAARAWNFRPFRMHTLQSLQQQLSDDSEAVAVYQSDPFNPFAIAGLRIGAYEKATVMQYIDTLIKWGDHMFAQDSWESITAATILYVYAYDILGPKPQQVGDCGTPTPVTFADIKKAYESQPGGIPTFLISLENLLPAGEGGEAPPPLVGHAFNDLNSYFCVPENETFTTYWDTVADRLYKIRHSMTIDGVKRQLALFQPPIDPMMLVKAAAAGADVQTLAAGGLAPLPPVRFRHTLERARLLAQRTASLGADLLSAIEKKDSADLVVLNNTQAKQLLTLGTQVREDAIAETQATLDGLQQARAGAQYRQDHYDQLITQGLIPAEIAAMDASATALAFRIIANILKTSASIGYAVPQVGSPFAMTYGGKQIGASLEAGGAAMDIGADIASYIADRSRTNAEHLRRASEWSFQKDLAVYDVKSLDQQITATETRLAMVRQELVLHQKQIEQNQEVADTLAKQFTGPPLYQWLIGRVSSVYFQTYQLALEAARQAQTAYQFELTSSDTFLDFNYWDDLHKGLTAGQSLLLALDRMEDSYQKANTRRLEIERTVSLALTDPEALLTLRKTGQCSFKLTEALFDYDYPGHYARQIKTLSLSIPAVVGPYQNIKATLTQLKNTIVLKQSIEAVDYLLGLSDQAPAGDTLRQDWAPNQRIAVSRGLDDSGLFVLDFRDERYLPFEGTGTVSDWQLDLPQETNRFDVSSLSDVIITVRYTALWDDGFAAKVRSSLGRKPLDGGAYVDVGTMAPTAWQALMADHSSDTAQTLTVPFEPPSFGWYKSVKVTKVLVQLTVAKDVTLPASAQFLSVVVGTQARQTLTTLADGTATLNNLSWTGAEATGSWVFTFDLAALRKTPALAALLADNKWLDPDKVLNLEIIALWQGTVF